MKIKIRMSEKAVSVATLARVLICGDDPRVPCLGVWSEGGRTPAASWQKPSPWFCQQFAGLCWWYCGSQVQLRFLWCGRNWFESVPRAVQMYVRCCEWRRCSASLQTTAFLWWMYVVNIWEFISDTHYTAVFHLSFWTFFFNKTTATPTLAGSDTHSGSDSEQDWSRFRRQTLNSLKRRLALR